jgi:hypothetical protein
MSTSSRFSLLPGQTHVPIGTRRVECAAQTPNDPTGLAEARVDANRNKSIDVALIELVYIPRNLSGYDFVILTLQVLQEL